MSADNFLAIRATTDGRFTVTMEFASDNKCLHFPVHIPPTFETRAAARDYAFGRAATEYLEYGVSEYVGECDCDD